MAFSSSSSPLKKEKVKIKWEIRYRGGKRV
jgi:hypothetical protein